jgi:sorting nexin-25
VDRDPEEVIDGEKVEDLMVFVNRLGVAKKRVDKRIATLSGEHVDFVSTIIMLSDQTLTLCMIV